MCSGGLVYTLLPPGLLTSELPVSSTSVLFGRSFRGHTFWVFPPKRLDKGPLRLVALPSLSEYRTRLCRGHRDTGRAVRGTDIPPPGLCRLYLSQSPEDKPDPSEYQSTRFFWSCGDLKKTPTLDKLQLRLVSFSYSVN